MKLFSNKKGQGLSLNVIIVAAIALIVLVVLVAVFTGRIGLFEKTIGSEADSELRSMQAFYGKCQPSPSQEVAFKAEYGQAANVESEQEAELIRQEAKASLRAESDRCKNEGVDRTSCENIRCTWS